MPELTAPVLRTISDLGELESLSTIWKSWPATRDSDLDLLVRTIRSRARCRPHVILVTRNERPDAIVVGLHQTRNLALMLGGFTIFQAEVNILEFLPGGLRGNASEDNCAAIVRNVMGSLKKRDADIAVWQQLDVESPIYNYALRWPRFVSRDYCPRIDYHWWLRDLPGGLHAFLMSRSKSHRAELRRKYKKVLFHFAGRVRIRCCRSVTDLEPAIADVEQIASKTKRRIVGRSGFFDTPRAREEMAAAAERGCLRIYILYLDETPVAFWKGAVYAGCLQGEHVGYDPAWNEFSPGIVLFLTMLDGLRGEGITAVDLGFGDTQFKHCLGNSCRIESHLRIYAPTLRGSLLNILNVASRLATHCAQFLLRQSRYLERARNAWREHLVRERSHEDGLLTDDSQWSLFS